MTNSHIQNVAVFTQYNSRSLNLHLSSSKWWDFGRKQGGLFVFTPSITPENGDWYRGTADALYQNLTFLKNSHEPYVVIAAGDGVTSWIIIRCWSITLRKRQTLPLSARTWKMARM